MTLPANCKFLSGAAISQKQQRPTGVTGRAELAFLRSRQRKGGSQIQFHLGVDQSATDTEHAVAEAGGAERGIKETTGIEETTGDGFEITTLKKSHIDTIALCGFCC